MHRHDRIAALALLVLALYSACVISQPAVTTDDATPDMINATFEAVNGDASLSNTARDDLLATLATALNNLDSAAQQRQLEKKIRKASEDAPGKIAKFKQQLAATPAGESLQGLLGKAPTLEAINSQVALVEADLQSVERQAGHPAAGDRRGSRQERGDTGQAGRIAEQAG